MMKHIILSLATLLLTINISYGQSYTNGLVRWSPTEDVIAYSDGGSIRLFTPDFNLIDSINVHQNAPTSNIHITRFAWSPNGQRIAVRLNDSLTGRSPSTSQVIEIWERQIDSTWIKVDEIVNHTSISLAWGINSENVTIEDYGLLSGTTTIFTYDVNTGNPLLEWVPPYGSLTSIIANPVFEQLAIESTEIHVWDTSTTPPSFINTIQPGVSSNVLAYSPTGDKIAVTSGDHSIINIYTNQDYILDMTLLGTAHVVHMVWKNDYIISHTLDEKIAIWNAVTGQLENTIENIDFAGSNSAMAVSPDGAKIVTITSEHGVHTRDAQTGEVLATLAGGPVNPTCDYDIAAGDEAALIQAINAAKANPGAAVICLANSTYTFTSVAEWSQGPNALPNITDEITIIGNGATLTRDSSLSDARVARVASGGTLTVENVIFDDWDTYDSGGVFYIEGTLSLTDSTLRNSSGEQGGALYSTAGGTLTIADSTFESNSAGDEGADVFNEGGIIEQ